MESNDNLEQLLKRMYAHEEEHIDTSDIIDDAFRNHLRRHPVCTQFARTR